MSDEPVVTVTAGLARPDIERIEEGLLAALRREQAGNDMLDLYVTARDADGCLVGGLIAYTSYGWLAVDQLWIDETRRGGGLGARLVLAAEAEAQARGCHSAWLETSNAEVFYRQLGYEPFGELATPPAREPAGHRRVFMRKTFA